MSRATGYVAILATLLGYRLVTQRRKRVWRQDSSARVDCRGAPRIDCRHPDRQHPSDRPRLRLGIRHRRVVVGPLVHVPRTGRDLDSVTALGAFREGRRKPGDDSALWATGACIVAGLSLALLLPDEGTAERIILGFPARPPRSSARPDWHAVRVSARLRVDVRRHDAA